MATEAIPALTVFARPYCHLCDDMIAGLRRLQATRHFEFAVVDVDDDPLLEARYGERVPVLAGGGRELCHYFLDGAAVTAFLAQFL
jgi:thioredoxin-like negative regulator of GroEL